MGIIPKDGEEKEAVGVIPVLLVHYLLGLGIVVLGQRTKNVLEFWGGVSVFLIAIFFLFYSIAVGGGMSFFQANLLGTIYVLFSLLIWLYIIGRLIWIAVKKETKLTII